ncbi:SH3 domain-containing protein [Leptospira ognonensis]|nr:SH3 domain-containing protein [Leptospira ognonensis]
MKKRILLLILLLILCKPGEKHELSQEEIEFDNQLTKASIFYYVNTKSGLRLRENPSLDSPKLLLIPYNSPLEILAEDDKDTTIDNKIGRWLKVSFRDEKDDNHEGYVFSHYLSPENQVRFYNKSKQYYYSLLFEPKCTNDIYNKCSVITFYDSNNKRISDFTWNPDNIKWYDDTIVSASESNGDGGGYASSMKHFNIINSKMQDMYFIGGDFDNDAKGFRKINVSIINKHFVFELNTISNSLIIFESDNEYKVQNKIQNIQPPAEKKIDLDLEHQFFKINFEKSIILKDKLLFSFFDKPFEIKL